MPAAILEISKRYGFPNFYCPFCSAPVFTDGDGMADQFCQHVMVFVDWVGEPSIGPDAPPGLSKQLDDIEYDAVELAGLFGDDTVVIELYEPGRGGGHDGTVCLVALNFGQEEEDD